MNWNKISPKRKNESYLIYVEHEGSDFKVIGDWDPWMFKELKKKKWFLVRSGDVMEKVYPAFATLVKGVDNWDFVFERLKEANTKKTLTEYLFQKI